MKKLYVLVVIFLCTQIGYGKSFEEYSNAINHVEASGRKSGIPDHKDTDGKIVKGPFQEKYDYWFDATHRVINGKLTKVYPGTWNDCRNYAYAKQVVYWYAERYEPQALDEMNYTVLARLHNGGPNWKHYNSTLIYWRRVNKYLNKKA